VPRLNCSVSPPTVTGFACALLLNPIDTRAGATGTDSMIIEYRASTDCPTIGGAGSPGLGTRLSQ
jgi:hypothetical protein